MGSGLEKLSLLKCIGCGFEVMCDCNTQAEDNVEKEEDKVRVEENLVKTWKR